MAILIEAEHSLVAHQLHGFLCVREGVLDVDVVVLLNSIKQLVGLGVQTTSVQATNNLQVAKVSQTECCTPDLTVVATGYVFPEQVALLGCIV